MSFAFTMPLCFFSFILSRAVSYTGIVLLGLALVSCTGAGTDTYVERSVEDLYAEAQAALDSGDHQASARAFNEVERQHPYSMLATRAQLMSAYAYYEGAKYNQAVLALERFIQLHPGHSDAPYAYYLKALCYYEQISDVGRDQKMTELARQSLEGLIRRFPDTSYARDARLKLDLTLDHLAGKEMEVGRWYLNKQKYAAALRRFQNVIRNFDGTTHIPEALYRLTEAYTLMGLRQEAKKVAAVLGHNYPGNEWYSDAYNLVEQQASDSQ